MAARSRSFPNLPGTFASGPFRLTLSKFHGQKQIGLVYRDELIARFEAAELVDLEEVVRRMSLFVTEECFAKLPPDEG
jgi:hypothetical protein